MKLFFVLLFFCCSLNPGNSQHWNTIQQVSLGVAYDLPQAWYVGGHTTQKACNCQGATVNSSPEGALSMMIVVGKEQQENLIAEPIWGYEWKPVEEAGELIIVEHLTFERKISTWKQSPKEIVLSFVGKPSAEKPTYILYFWGSLEAIQQYKETIEQIMTSFQPL